MKKTKNEINPILPRANAKLVRINNQIYLVGGMTAKQVTCQIYQLKIHHEDGQHQVEWKPLKFKNHIFKPRNSFGACGSNKNIYIWGGLETQGMQQKCISELIEVDVEKGEMRSLPLIEKICIHSPAMMYDEKENQLLAFGGTNESSTMEGLFYTLNLNVEGQAQYEWKKARLDSEHHKGFLWQHTAHLSSFSYFTGDEGKFLTSIGGCRYPYSPYSSIVEFDLNTMKQRNATCMKTGLVSHDSLTTKNCIVIFGGANGGGLNNERISFDKGNISYSQAHNAVGCSCCDDEECQVVIGGVCGPQSLNSVIIYPK